MADEIFELSRRNFVQGAASAAALAAVPATVFAAVSAKEADKSAVLAQIPKMHAENVKRLQEWIALPSIAAENRNYPQGPEHMAKLARDAGFTGVKLIPTAGKPGVFGRIDAGADTTMAIYFMYDVKQFVPEEWSSPPLEARLVQKEGLGTICMGRGAVNQKGPENSFLSALMAFKAAGKKLPVNLVLVCEGEEEIASPHFQEVVRNPEVMAQLKKCAGVFMPEAGQDRDGGVQVSLGAKGVVELELICSGEKWGRGPAHDVHSSLEAQVDSPTWHLVQALNTLVEKDGHTPAVEGFFDKAKPLTAAQVQMIKEHAAKTSESSVKKALGVQHWVQDKDWLDSLMLLESRPTINIEGLVAGYTGPGGKTILPHKAVAKIDMRLVPDMTAADTLAKLKAHLAKHGFADIEVNMSGGYDPTQTDADSKLIKTQLATYRKLGLDPVLWPRSAGSWPGHVFTDAPLRLPAGHFGLGHGTGAHAPDEYYLIESSDPKIRGLDGAVGSFVEYLYALS
ncbi:MAG TPA: M20/M25/M40 family metallo-hydrolase [Steroidobacteraceae bacterium]|jgi:acetylornithine deacetylase/succinyl-diaminopimelate desuccinylase-like protein|nr:M20/M25/M40 family metallo-hydrolase [Steroidobacteraceae bacterium]